MTIPPASDDPTLPRPSDKSTRARVAPAGDLLVVDEDDDDKPGGALEVFQHRPFLLLWLSQVFTQIGGNMVLFGLTVIVLDSGAGNTAVSILILTFLAPAVLLSAVAGVYVDRLDKRLVLVATNLLRAGLLVLLWLAGTNLLLLLLINMLISTVTVFFAPAEASMIPELLPRRLLLPANGLFTLTLNAAFAVGYAVAGPLVVALLGAPGLILVVAVCYLIAALFCWTLPPSPPIADRDEQTGALLPETEAAMGSVFGQLREGIAFIRENPAIGWSLVYLGIAASMVGVLGVLGPKFATDSLGLQPKDFAVVVLPLGFGVVMGILALNSFGHLAPRRRIIESGLVALGIFVSAIVLAGPISRALQHATASSSFGQEVASLTSLLAIVVFIAFLAGIAYACVAIPSQTQLQEDIPEEGRGRVFGVLNMLVSVSSFLPIIIVGPMSDLFGSTIVLVIAALLVTVCGIVSIIRRGPLGEEEVRSPAIGPAMPSGLDPVAVATAREVREGRHGPRLDGASSSAARSGAPAAAGSGARTAVIEQPTSPAVVGEPGAPGAVEDPEPPSDPPFEPHPDEHE